MTADLLEDRPDVPPSADPAPPEGPPTAPDGGRPDGLHGWVRWCWLLPILPAIASLVSAVAQGWVPVADAAVAAVRGADIGRGRFSTLGMPASVSEFAPGPMRYHPGPLLFWALGPFTWVLGAQMGAAVGAVAVNLAASIGTIRAVGRAGRPRLVVLATLATLLTGITVWGPGHLYDPFNTMLPTLALLCVLALAWRLLCGDGDVLPWAILAASFSIQVHIVYAVPILATLGPAAAVALGPARWRPAGTRRPSRERLAASLALGLVLWAGPLANALANGGGNLRVLTQGTEGSAVIGPRALVAAVAQVLALPPIPFLNMSDSSFFRPITIVSVVVLAGVGTLVWRCARRGPSEDRRLLVVAALAVLAAGATVGLLPDEPIKVGQTSFYKVVYAFAWLAILGSWVETWALHGGRRKVVSGLAAGLVVIVAAASCFPFPIRNGVDADSWLFDATPALGADLDHHLDPATTYRMEARGGTRYLLLMYGLLADLDDRGRDVGVTAERDTNYGPERVLDDDTPTLRVQPPNLPVPDGAVLVASYRPDVDAEAAAALQDELLRRAQEHGTVRLTSNGRNQLGTTLLGYPGVDEDVVARLQQDPSLLLELPAEDLAAMYRNDWVIEPSLPGDLRDDYVRLLGPSAVDVWLLP